MKKLLICILLIIGSFSTVARAADIRTDAALRYQPVLSNHHDQGPWNKADRRRQDDERRRKKAERRRQDDERRRKEAERRRQDDERRRKEAERRRQDEQRRWKEAERRRQDEQRRRKEAERRRQDERRRRKEAERRRQGAPPPPPRKRRPAPVPVPPPRHDSYGRVKARQVIRKTTIYLERAQRAARRGYYRYGLGKAYAHQKEARNLYLKRWYRQAIAHSLRARKISQNIIDANRPGGPRRLEHYYGRYDDEIDNKLSIRIEDDKAVLKFRIQLDL
ncbi:MAG: hypothetical protein PVH64_09840 [Bacillota bacterium]